MQGGPRAGLLWLALFVSLFGSGMSSAALSWFVLERTGSTVALGVLWVLITAPGLLVPALGGVLIDRMERRRLAILLDLARGVMVLLSAALVREGELALPTVYVLALLLGAAFSISWPTLSALVQEVSPLHGVVRSNAAYQVSVQAGMMAAGALVGLAYDALGLSGILLLDGLSYGVSALCLFRLRSAAGALSPPPQAGAFLTELREGLDYLRGHPPVLAMGAAWACMMGGVLSATVLLVALSRDVLQAGARGYGFLEAGWATGAVLGGALATRVLARTARPLLAMSMLALLAAGHVVLPYLTLLAAAVGAQVAFGCSRALGGVAMQSSIMDVVPPRLMGRVQSAFSTISTLLQVAMSLTLGWMAQAVSLRAAFVAVGALYAAASLAAWQARRGLPPALPGTIAAVDRAEAG